MTAPNEIWTADFKGQFRTRDARHCCPLTVVDRYIRFLLGCQGLRAPSHQASYPVFRASSKNSACRGSSASTTVSRSPRPRWGASHNSPCGGSGSHLPRAQRTGPPEQNGRHERLHRTLKAEATRPAQADLARQQRCFNAFRQAYKVERPHESLDQQTRASVCTASRRPFPPRIPHLEYPGHFEVRLVSHNGGIRWNARWVNVSHVLGGQYVGLEAIDDGLWDVYFGSLKLGRFDERQLRIIDALGRHARRKLSLMSLD